MPDLVSPAAELTQLKQDLEGKQSDTSRLAKEIDQLKARIADLSKTVVDIDQKTSAYEKAASATGDQLQKLAAYVNTEKTMLKAALEPGSMTDIESKKNAALQKLADLKSGLSGATKKVADVNTAYSSAKDATGAAQVAYKAIADLPAANTDVINDLAGLRSTADKQGATNSLGRQYFLVLVMEDRLKAIKTLTPEEYNRQLNDAGSALAEASNAQSTGKDELDAAVAAQKQTQKDLDDATAKWRQATLDSIPATPAPESKAPPPG